MKKLLAIALLFVLSSCVPEFLRPYGEVAWAGSLVIPETASEIANAPAGNIAATDVQGAINELDTEKEAAGTAAGLISNTAFGSGWSGVTTIAPTKNAVYDEMVLRAPLTNPTFTGTVNNSVDNAGAVFYNKVYSDNTSHNPQWASVRYGGSVASPTATPSGTALGSFSMRGYDGVNSPTTNAYFAAFSAELFSKYAKGNFMSWVTTSEKNTALQERMRLDLRGRLGIGTNSPSYTFDLKTIPYVPAATFTGSGLNDGHFGGAYTGTTASLFTVEIDATGTPDTFKWRKDSGSWTTGVAITGNDTAQTLTNGITFSFTASTGHTFTDYWSTTIIAQSPLRIRNLAGTELLTSDDTGNFDFGSAVSLKLPTSAGAVPTLSGRIAYDSTANRFVVGANGSTRTLAFTTDVLPAFCTKMVCAAGVTGACNYTCDGTADDVQIQAAFDSFSSVGTVCLSKGSFNVAATINVTGVQKALLGAGKAVTSLYRTADYGSTFYVHDPTASYLISFSEFGIYHSTNKMTSGSLIDANVVSFLYLHNVRLMGGLTNLAIRDVTTAEIQTSDLGTGSIYVSGDNTSNIKIAPGSSGQGTVNVQVIDTITGSDDGIHAPTQSIWITDGLDFYRQTGGHISGSSVAGVLIDCPLNKTCQDLDWDGVYFDSNTLTGANGAKLQGAGTIMNTTFRNGRMFGQGYGDSAIITVAGPTIRGLYVDNQLIMGYRKHGADIAGNVTTFKITGGTITDNGRLDSTTYDNIHVGDNMNDVYVGGGVGIGLLSKYSDASKKARYGLYLGTGCTDCWLGDIAYGTQNTAPSSINSTVSNLVHDTRTVNGKPLSSDIILGLASADFVNQGTTTTVLHGNASGNPAFAGIGVNDFTANQGTVNQHLIGNASGQPSWVAAPKVTFLSNDQNVNGGSCTTAVTTTDLTFLVPANATVGFHCNLLATGTSTSAIRYAVATSQTMTNFGMSATKYTTSLTAGIHEAINNVWASTCTNCTAAVTSGVSATTNSWALDGSGLCAGAACQLTIYVACSTNSQANVLKKGSYCQWWTN